MIKHGEPNPLNIFGLRRLPHCPPHCEYVEFDSRAPLKDIIDWIYENLEGRFWIGDTYNPTKGGSMTLNKRAAFEKPSEASYFALMLDTFNTTTW